MKTTNDQLPAIQKESETLNGKVQSITIASQEDMQKATDILSKLNVCLDSLIEEKELITKPMNEALREVRGRYKPTETRLEEAIGALRKSMSRYQTEETARIDAETAKIADRVGDGKGRLKIETAVRKMETLNTLDKKTTTANGSVSFKPAKMFEVTDIGKLPIAYHTPNETAIRSAMREGTELPGVRYWIEQVPINRR